jgi:hypothetical protein
MGEAAGLMGAAKGADALLCAIDGIDGIDDREPAISPDHDDVWDLAEIQRMRGDFLSGRNVRADAEARGPKARV